MTIFKTFVTPEIIEDKKVFAEAAMEHIRREIKEAFEAEFVEHMKMVDYEFLYGEGAYEEFIFGGAPGL